MGASRCRQKSCKSTPKVVVCTSSPQPNRAISWSIGMCDEKWVLRDDRKRSVHCLNCVEEPKYFPKSKFFPKKMMVIVWWSAADLIHHSFLSSSETITAEKCYQQMDEILRKLQFKSPVLVNRKGSLLHENARSDVVQPMLQKLNELGYETLEHSSYSLDLSPTDHFDNFLRGKNASESKTMKRMHTKNSLLLELHSFIQLVQKMY
ncbi:Histone-lysine N-methyltransferase SETMAR [Araneus ventricosus]|uniref:Histone-lysine N-methyltransferase SETMAR n=1 Tax=Araneus ventricosus TaxID=182803 RepID=A0A4Y2F6X4_ARAVE|nr:Histone-lysine N-methyltransferase SETMAR [Araneus ventricosus]